ncbi:MAG: hypothetical protein L6R36_004041 [Xanthoria steineri]|nr:MAG: hypothetical protein L6R36_004041 [Xanthoria steineri]
MAREQLLRQAAKALFGLTAAHRRSEAASMPSPAALSTQQPPAQYHKQPIAPPALPLGPTARLNLHDVEMILASLNRQINNTSEMDAIRLERLVHEKDRAVGRQAIRWPTRADTNDRSGRIRSRDRSIDRYVPIDRYTPRPKSQGSTAMAKRRREPSPADETELIAEVITQVARITKRVSGLHDLPGPQKRRKGAAEGLAVALLASVEELMAKTKEFTG